MKKKAQQPLIPDSLNNRILLFGRTTDDMRKLYECKNHDYGNSFAKARKEIDNYVLGKLYDKMCRLMTLMQGSEPKVNDESIEDTLMDLANYAVMELVERRIDNGDYIDEGCLVHQF